MDLEQLLGALLRISNHIQPTSILDIAIGELALLGLVYAFTMFGMGRLVIDGSQTFQRVARDPSLLAAQRTILASACLTTLLALLQPQPTFGTAACLGLVLCGLVSAMAFDRVVFMQSALFDIEPAERRFAALRTAFRMRPRLPLLPPTVDHMDPAAVPQAVGELARGLVGWSSRGATSTSRDPEPVLIAMANALSVHAASASTRGAAQVLGRFEQMWDQAAHDIEGALDRLHGPNSRSESHTTAIHLAHITVGGLDGLTSAAERALGENHCDFARRIILTGFEVLDRFVGVVRDRAQAIDSGDTSTKGLWTDQVLAAADRLARLAAQTMRGDLPSWSYSERARPVLSNIARRIEHDPQWATIHASLTRMEFSLRLSELRAIPDWLPLLNDPHEHLPMVTLNRLRSARLRGGEVPSPLQVAMAHADVITVWASGLLADWDSMKSTERTTLAPAFVRWNAAYRRSAWNELESFCSNYDDRVDGNWQLPGRWERACSALKLLDARLVEGGAMTQPSELPAPSRAILTASQQLWFGAYPCIKSTAP